jgi:hypothetical protein
LNSFFIISVRYFLVFIYLWYRTDRSSTERQLPKGRAGTSRSQEFKMRPVRRQEEAVPVRVYNSRGCAVTEGGERERPAIEAANAGAKKSQFMGGSPPKEDIEMQRRCFSGCLPLVFKYVTKRSEKVILYHRQLYTQDFYNVYQRILVEVSINIS